MQKSTILFAIILLIVTSARTAEVPNPTTPLPGGGSLARHLLGKPKAAPIDDPQLNVRILPAAGFEKWPEGKKLNPGMLHTFIDRSRMIFAGLFGGDIGQSADNDTVSVALSQVKISKQTQPEFIFTDPAPLPGAAGWSWWTQRGAVNGIRIHFAHAVRLNNGFLHQLTVWGSEERAAEIDQAIVRAAVGCTILDPNRASTGGMPAANGDDRQIGVRISFPEDGWFVPTAETDPSAKLFSRYYARLDQRWLGIVSLDCGQVIMPTSGEIIQALLSMTGSQQQEVPIVTVGDSLQATWRLSSAPNAPVFIARTWLLPPRIIIALGGADDPAPASIDRLRALISAVEPIRDIISNQMLPNIGATEMANRFGLTAFANGANDRAVAWFARAIAMSPHVPLFRKNLLHVLATSDREGDLLAAASAAHAEFPDDQEISAHLARAQVATGDAASGVAGYAKIFASGFRDQFHLARYISGLRALGAQKEILSVLEEYLSLGMDESVLIALADEYASVGDSARALTTLGRAPDSFTVAFARARILRKAGRAAEALELYYHQQKKHGVDLELELAIGETLLELERFDEALKAFQLARNLAPQDFRCHQYIALVQRMLGRGDSLNLCDDLIPVPLPEGLRQSQKVKAYGKEHSIILHQSTAVHWRPNEEYRRTDRQRIRILDTAGAEQFSTMQFSFDPVVDEIQVNRLAVYDAAGTLIAQGRPSDYYCIDRGDSAVTGGERVARLPVPGIAPGVEIELEVTFRQRTRLGRFPFLTWQVASMSPVAEACLAVDAPTGTLLWACPSAPLKCEPGTELRFRITDHPAIQFEPLMDITSAIPVVLVGDATESWGQIADSYLSEIEPLLIPDKSVRERAEKIVADLGQDAGTEVVIARFAEDVQQFSYRASSFGDRGRIPAEGSRTLADRSGDCKGLSVLLLQYLRCSGIDAGLALVSRSVMFSASTPSFEQFDHMVVYLADGRFIDPTTKHVLPLTQPPRGLERRTALILERGKSRVVTIPDVPLHSSSLHRNTRIEVSVDGSAVVRERYEIRGIYATDLRSGLQGLNDTESKRFARELIGVTSDRVDRISISNPKKLDEAVVVDAVWRHDQGFLAVRDLLAGRMTASWEQQYFFRAPCPERTTPFRISVPLDCTVSVLIVPAPGFRFVDLPAEVEAWEDQWHSVRRVIRLQADGALEVQLTVLQRSVRSPAAEYEKFQESAARVIRASRPTLVMSR